MEGKWPEPWGGRSGAQGRRGRGPACHLSRPARSAAGRGSAFPGPEIGESPLATSPDGRELWRPWSTTRSRTFAGITRQSAETALTLRGRAAPGRLLPCASPVGATMSLSKVTPACSACGMAARNPEVRGITGCPGEPVARVLLDWDSRERPGFCHCLFALLDLSCERSMLTSPKSPKL